MWKKTVMAIVDCETTGLDDEARVIELSVLRAEGEPFHVTSHLCASMNPGDIDWSSQSVREAISLNGLAEKDLRRMKPFSEIWSMFAPRIEEASILVGHFIEFDVRMLRNECARIDVEFPSKREIDTVVLDWGLHPAQESYSLRAVAERWGITYQNLHRAHEDAEICAKILGGAIGSLPNSEHDFQLRYDQWKAEHRKWRETRKQAPKEI